MTIGVIDSYEGMHRLRDEWWTLYRSCPRATPFQSPAWLLPWLQHLYRGGEIMTLILREEDALIGFAPLFCWGTGQRTVSFLGAGISDYGDLLYAPGRERECAEAVWEFLAEHHTPGDSMDLQELREGAALLVGQNTEPCAVCPVLDLHTYPDCMDPKQRVDVRRAKNRLLKNHRLDFRSSGEADLPACMEEFFGLYEVRWGALDPALREFHHAVAENFQAEGMLRLFLLRIDNQPAAAIYAFADNKTLYCYLSGFEPSLAKLSPGAVLLEHVIERARAEGMADVDFLRHPEAYKYLWGAKDRQNYKITGAGTSTVENPTLGAGVR